ncbi:MAG: transposase [Thermoanaerobaculia bacterium]
MFLLTTIVMPDHVHAVLQPLSDHKGLPHSLQRIFQLIKGRTSRFINQALSRKGTVWQDESTIIRFGTMSRSWRSVNTSPRTPFAPVS